MSDPADSPTQEAKPSAIGIAPILRFTPLSCSLTLSEGDGLADRLNFRLERGRHQSVRTPQGRDLADMSWFFEAYRGRSTHPDLLSTGAIGRLNFHPAATYDDDAHDEEAIFWAHLPEAQFDLIRDQASNGRLPAGVSFRVEGLSYDWEPDGSGKVWDVDAQPNAPVRGVDFIYNLVNQQEAEEEPGQVDPPALALARNVEHATRVTIPAHLAELKQIAMWATALLTLVAIFTR